MSCNQVEMNSPRTFPVFPALHNAYRFCSGHTTDINSPRIFPSKCIAAYSGNWILRKFRDHLSADNLCQRRAANFSGQTLGTSLLPFGPHHPSGDRIFSLEWGQCVSCLIPLHIWGTFGEGLAHMFVFIQKTLEGLWLSEILFGKMVRKPSDAGFRRSWTIPSRIFLGGNLMVGA